MSQGTPVVSLSDDREDRLGAVRRLANKPVASASKDLALSLSENEGPLIRRIAAIALGKLRVPEAKTASRLGRIFSEKAYQVLDAARFEIPASPFVGRSRRGSLD